MHLYLKKKIYMYFFFQKNLNINLKGIKERYFYMEANLLKINSSKKKKKKKKPTLYTKYNKLSLNKNSNMYF